MECYLHGTFPLKEREKSTIDIMVVHSFSRVLSNTTSHIMSASK
jgi:hypothetical protein